MLQKRNGYPQLSTLPDTSFSYLTTLNDNLTALGTSIAAYSEGTQTWITKGSIQPMVVSTLPLIRNNLNQIQSDVAIASNGLVCTVYTESDGTNSFYKYAIADGVTGQNIVAPTPLPAPGGAVDGSPRVFLVGNYFVILLTNLIGGTHNLQYTSVPVNNPTTPPKVNVDVATTYTPASTVSWDGVVANNTLYIAYNTTAGGQSIKVTSISAPTIASGGLPNTPTTFAGHIATMMTLCSEVINNNLQVYVSFYDSASMNGYTLAVNANLVTVFAPVQTTTSQPILNITSTAFDQVCTIYHELSNAYSYDSSIPTNYIYGTTISNTGTFGENTDIIRSLGLASKSFLVGNITYFLGAYQSPFQPTYFLINATESTPASPVISAKLAYENGGGYLPLGLPNVTVTGTSAQTSYLYKDLIAALSNANAAGTSTVGGIYSQTGINLSTFNITVDKTDSAEIGQVLQFSGGFLWMYDGYLPVEHNFFLWPDSVEVTTSTTGGFLTAQEYFYQAVYEWSDNQGNIYRSAGSIPVNVTTTGSTSANTVDVPTLRLTYKTANPVKLTIYRFSTAQEIWYEITSITSPVLNSTTSDSITYVDTQSDASISGNNILYTTGGVVEDINAPATNIMTLFDTRFWLVDAEDSNLLWYSKQVIENTPVEMSDLFTFYVAPTTAAQGSTGPITALAPLDDKLIIFKSNAIYYINGTGPDNTGANNDYSPSPVFITSTVGCTNQNSIVFTPQGLIFQSDKGLWLLGRDLNTSYVGAPVEKYNGSLVQSAVNVPASNQVRFTLNTGETLMYDYYYSQWGTFSGVPAISSCIYKGSHTYINALGKVFQELPNTYLDGTNPVLMSFTTSWLNLAGLQGYQRAFFFYLLGQYYTPHTLRLGVAYNYNPNVTQVSTITPNNYNTAFGAGPSQDPFGQGTPFGGHSLVEQWRVFLAQQRCQSFQLTLNEFYDPSKGVSPGAGLTLSGINAVVGISKDFRPISNRNSVGGGSNRG